MREFWDEILSRGGESETREKRIFQKKERIGNSYQDDTGKTLDFSLDLG